MISLLVDLGLKINVKKRLVVPAQKVAFLGHTICLESGTISPELDKVKWELFGSPPSN